MHAVLEFAAKYWDSVEQSTMVVLEVKNKWQLEKWAQDLEDQDKMFAIFHEPDIANELTALACFDEGEIFRRLNLVSQ